MCASGCRLRLLRRSRLLPPAQLRINDEWSRQFMSNDSSESHTASVPLGSSPQLRFGKIEELGSRVGAAVAAARKYLFSQQHEEGYWCGELEADTTLESDYILLHMLLGTGNQERFQKAANWILQHQNEDGGWSIYAAGPSNISASVKAYFVVQ